MTFEGGKIVCVQTAIKEGQKSTKVMIVMMIMMIIKMIMIIMLIVKVNVLVKVEVSSKLKTFLN